jgi:hypothetical protein
VLDRSNKDSLAAQNLVHCCSLINNYQILKCESYPKNLACLNGIRVMSLCWVILGHTIIFAVYYSGTFAHAFKQRRTSCAFRQRREYFQLVSQILVSNHRPDHLQHRFILRSQVDLFDTSLRGFHLAITHSSASGLLTSFTYFMSKGENETFSLVRFILNHYVYHYVR